MRTAMRSIRIFSRGVWRFEIYLRFKLLRALRSVRDLLLRDLRFKRSDLRSVLRSVFERLRSVRLPPACPEHGHVISII